MLLNDYPRDEVLQAIAAENNLAETAFLVRSGDRHRLRWFTPTLEVPLCGHATLATGAVVLDRLEPHRDQVVFDSASGPLTVTRTPTGYLMDLPARTAAPTHAPPGLAAETRMGVRAPPGSHPRDDLPGGRTGRSGPRAPVRNPP